MDATHLRQLFDQLLAFLCRDEFGRSHCVDQQLQLRQREKVTAQGISVLTAALLLDIHAHIAELLYVGRYCLAVAGNAVALQKSEDVRRCCIMLGIRVLPKVFQYV